LLSSNNVPLYTGNRQEASPRLPLLAPAATPFLGLVSGILPGGPMPWRGWGSGLPPTRTYVPWEQQYPSALGTPSSLHYPGLALNVQEM